MSFWIRGSAQKYRERILALRASVNAAMTAMVRQMQSREEENMQERSE
jgi:hypothetical protein